MNRVKWQIILGLLLVAVSAILYNVQIRIFHSPRDTYFYLFQDLAFIPIQVLLVTLILNQLLNVREKLSMLNKLNMVIGTFFSEVGTTLLRSFAAIDQNTDGIREELLIKGEWTDQQFAAVIKRVRGNEFGIQYTGSDLEALKTILTGKAELSARIARESKPARARDLYRTSLGGVSSVRGTGRTRRLAEFAAG